MLEALFTRENIESFVRHTLTTAGGGLLANGTIDGDTFNAVVGGIVALVGFGWAYFKNKKAVAK